MFGCFSLVSCYILFVGVIVSVKGHLSIMYAGSTPPPPKSAVTGSTSAATRMKTRIIIIFFLNEWTDNVKKNKQIN